jgi:hypothetical protein
MSELLILIPHSAITAPQPIALAVAGSGQPTKLTSYCGHRPTMADADILRFSFWSVLQGGHVYDQTLKDNCCSGGSTT